MEFTCLHCRHSLAADDDRVGERVACPNCSAMLTVPTPIGGKLTGRRLGTPYQIPRPSEFPSSVADETESTLQMEEPIRGFRFDARLPKILGKDERIKIQQSVDSVIEQLESHLDRYPQVFRSGAFVLEVDHLDVDSGNHDARLRLFGSLNHEPFNASISVVGERTKYSGGINHFGLLGALILTGIFRLAEGISWLLFRQQVLHAHHRHIQKTSVRHFRIALDEAVQRPLGFFAGIWHWLHKPL